MKNLHIIPTDKPSRLYLTTHEYIFEEGYSLSTDECENKHIYITNDEEIKRIDYWLNIDNNTISNGEMFELANDAPSCKKIILTTDQDLIKDGVQAIDDEFLEWFVKNPSCEYVEVYKDKRLEIEQDFNFYEIIIPREEDCTCTDECLGYLTKTCKRIETLEQIDQNNPVTRGSTALVYKQETLEEAAENYAKQFDYAEDSSPQLDFINGAKSDAARDYWFEIFKKKEL